MAGARLYRRGKGEDEGEVYIPELHGAGVGLASDSVVTDQRSCHRLCRVETSLLLRDNPHIRQHTRNSHPQLCPSHTQTCPPLSSTLMSTSHDYLVENIREYFYSLVQESKQYWMTSPLYGRCQRVSIFLKLLESVDHFFKTYIKV